MRRSDHAEELYERAVRLMLGTGTAQQRLAAAAAEVGQRQPAGMSGEIQQAHECLMNELRDHASIAGLSDANAARLAMQVVEVYVVVRLHHNG